MIKFGLITVACGWIIAGTALYTCHGMEDYVLQAKFLIVASAGMFLSAIGGAIIQVKSSETS